MASEELDNNAERVTRRGSIFRMTEDATSIDDTNMTDLPNLSRISLPPIPQQPGQALKVLGRCLNSATLKVMKQGNVPSFVKHTETTLEGSQSPIARRELLIKEEDHTVNKSFRRTWKLTDESHMLSTGIALSSATVLPHDPPECSLLWKSIHSAVRAKSYASILSSRPGLYRAP